MVLLEFTARLVAGVVAMMLLAGALFVDRQQISTALENPVERTRAIVPHVALLAGTLLLNRVFRHLGQELSWLIGLNITGVIYSLEGEFVALLQSVVAPPLVSFFSFVYLYGYVFLVSFPVVLYWLLEDSEPLRKTLLAYTLNYAFGLVCYTLFIAFGPRNLLPDTVQELLYATYPQSQVLTSTINTNTNAFPSLHTSLSVTVALLARRTREQYLGWATLAPILAALVVISTMYLGIHWATDVVAGALLAVLSVRFAERYYDAVAIDLPSRSDVLPSFRRR